MPLVTIWDYVYQSGSGVAGTTAAPPSKLTVTATLNTSQAVYLSNPNVEVEPLRLTTTTDPNGYFQFQLAANDQISPANTLWVISIPGLGTFQVTVSSQSVPANGWQVSAIVVNTPAALSPATISTGPLTINGALTVNGSESLSGNQTVGGTLGVTGATTLGGSLTANAAATFNAALNAVADLTAGARLLFSAAVSKLIPGATSFSIRDNADANDNLLVSNVGLVTARAGLVATAGGVTATAGDLVATAGKLSFGAAASRIVPGATSLSLRNTANGADNVLVSDAGLVTLRNGLQMPPAAGGSVATTLYSSMPVKIDEVIVPVIGSASVNLGGTTLPTGFRHLEIRYQARGSNASLFVECGLRFNGDTGLNYGYERVSAVGAAIVAQDSGATAYSSGRSWFIPGASAQTSYAGSGTIWIPNYGGSTFKKMARVQADFYQLAGAFPPAGAITNDETTLVWDSIAAITRLDLITVTGGSFIVSSLFTLYGWP